MNELGTFIKEQRAVVGLTIIDLAKLTGLSQGYISQIETGKRDPTVQVIERIAKALNLEAADILEKKKDTIIIKTNRVSHNIKIHKMVEALENANLEENELDYIVGLVQLNLKYIKSKQ